MSKHVLHYTIIQLGRNDGLANARFAIALQADDDVNNGLLERALRGECGDYETLPDALRAALAHAATRGYREQDCRFGLRDFERITNQHTIGMVGAERLHELNIDTRVP